MKKRFFIVAFLLVASLGAVAWNTAPPSAAGTDEMAAAWVEWISGIPETASLAIAGAALLILSWALHQAHRRQAGREP